MSDQGFAPEEVGQKADPVGDSPHQPDNPARGVAAELRAEMGFPVEPSEIPVEAGAILAELRMDLDPAGSQVIELTERVADVTQTSTVLPPTGESAPTLR